MRTSIKIITISGNKSTTPKGIDIFELPFKRMRLLKKANLGRIRSFRRLTSSKDGGLGEEGIRFTNFCMSPIDAAATIGDAEWTLVISS